MARYEVEVEEVVARYQDPRNGAGPMWCYGSPPIVRAGDLLFAGVPETDPALEGLCNTRWQVFRRDATGWVLMQAGAEADEREPCPLIRVPGDRLVLSVNPLADPGSPGRKGRCIPHLLAFDAARPKAPPTRVMPVWDRDYAFTEHSYRGIGTDPASGEVLLLNIDGHDGYAWSLMDRSGNWSRMGKVRFPIRACYPQVGIRDGAAHLLAVGDIVEANPEWRAYKQERTGRAWDYDFRRLFYAWSRDLRAGEFGPPIEVDSREETAGHIRNLDAWIDGTGAAHLLYTTKNIWHDFMRDRFFPGTPLVSTVEYRVVRDGRIAEGRCLATHEKDERDPDAAARPSGIHYRGGAFHLSPDGTLRALFTAGDAGTFVRQVHPWTDEAPVRIGLRHGLHSFFVPSPRMGADVSACIDMFGAGSESGLMRYARVRIR